MYGIINTSFKKEDQVYSGTGFKTKDSTLSRSTKKHCIFIISSRNVLVISAVICASCEIISKSLENPSKDVGSE